MGAFCDGYFLVLDGDDNSWQISALEDGTSWDGLDIAQVSTSSDRVVSLAVSHRQVWLFGTKTTQVWYNSGNADFPFEPIGRVHRTGHPRAVVRRADRGHAVLDGLGCARRGDRAVDGERLHAGTRVDRGRAEDVLRHYASLQAQSALSDVIAWAYQEDGHAFYVLYLPQGPLSGSGIDYTSWVYDVTEQAWHERARWNDTTHAWEPAVARCHAFMWGLHLVGDRARGTVYVQALDVYDEAVS